MASVATTSRSRPSADPALDELLGPVLEAFESCRPGEDDATIVEAARASELAHRGQMRRSGEDYVTHPVAVALTVAELGLDAATVAAALLHDAVEDTGMSLANVRAQFGEVVARVVDGVTKLDRLEFDSKEAQQAATIRKMFLAMATDWRVLLIKLADRLHNMRTIAVMPEVNQRDHRPRDARRLRPARAPPRGPAGQVAARGPRVRDAAAQALRRDRPDGRVADARARAVRRRRERAPARQARRRGDRRRALGSPEAPVEHLREDGRQRQGVRRDLRPRRAARGRQRPSTTAGRRSARCTRCGTPCRAGSRTTSTSPSSTSTSRCTRRSSASTASRSRSRSAPRRCTGAPSTASPRTGATRASSSPSEMAWMRRLIDAEQESTDAIDFLEALKLDLEQDEVYVFTPKGRVLGPRREQHAGRLRLRDAHRGRPPLRRARRSTGGSCRSTPRSAPGTSWRSSPPRPRPPARRGTGWGSSSRRARARRSASGSRVSGARTRSRPVATSSSGHCGARGSRSRPRCPRARSASCAPSSNLQDLDGLVRGDRREQSSRPRPSSSGSSASFEAARRSRSRRPSRADLRLGTGPKRGAGVYVEGLDDVMVRLARCCTPVPGDQILGFVTQGRGVSVHRTDCSNATALASESRQRLVDVEWDASSERLVPRLARGEGARPRAACSPT